MVPEERDKNRCEPDPRGTAVRLWRVHAHMSSKCWASSPENSSSSTEWKLIPFGNSLVKPIAAISTPTSGKCFLLVGTWFGPLFTPWSTSLLFEKKKFCWWTPKFDHVRQDAEFTIRVSPSPWTDIHPSPHSVTLRIFVSGCYRKTGGGASPCDIYVSFVDNTFRPHDSFIYWTSTSVHLLAFPWFFQPSHLSSVATLPNLVRQVEGEFTRCGWNATNWLCGKKYILDISTHNANQSGKGN